jgi:hypothetical protein
MNKDKIETITVISIGIIATAILLGMLLTVLTINFKRAEEYQATKQETPVVQCEHEFIVTSRYNILLKRYRTFSKCIK